MLFDSHAHYSSPEYDQDRDQVLEQAFASSLTGIIEAGTNFTTSRQAAALAEQYPGIYATAGIQPYYAGRPEAGDTDAFRGLLKHEKVVGIGEIGLDYHYTTSREDQLKVFRAMLELAGETGLPVAIHLRDAEEDMHRFLDDPVMRDIRGVFHCFSGSRHLAEKALERGLYLSLAGMVTFKNYKNMDAVRAIPLGSLLVESDAPYLAPEPFRGRRYLPEYLTHTVKTLSGIYKVTPNELADRAARTTMDLYGIAP